MRTRRSVLLGFIGLALCLPALHAHGQDELAFDEDAANAAREAIASATRRFVDAYNQGDMATMKSLWAADGDIVSDDGRRLFFQDQAAPPPRSNAIVRAGDPPPPPRPTLTMSIDSLRFITPQVASVDGVSVFRNAGTAEGRHRRYTAVWVQRGNHWMFDTLRENAIPVSAHHAHLTELSWMVGTWADAAVNPRLRLRYRWNADGNYLERDYQGHLPGRGDHAGVERIGWDALAGEFRSWAFNHDGGYLQGQWTAIERGWTLECTGVTAEGKRMGGEIQIHQLNAHVMEWVFVNGTLDGQPVPDFRIRLYRVGVAPQ